MQDDEDEHEMGEKERREKIAAMQKRVDDGLKSGIGAATKEELFARALASIAAAGRPGETTD